MTNADYIRAMSDVDLAVFLCNLYDPDTCSKCIATEYCYEGHSGMLDWLKRTDLEDEANGG